MVQAIHVCSLCGQFQWNGKLLFECEVKINQVGYNRVSYLELDRFLVQQPSKSQMRFFMSVQLISVTSPPVGRLRPTKIAGKGNIVSVSPGCFCLSGPAQ